MGIKRTPHNALLSQLLGPYIPIWDNSSSLHAHSPLINSHAARHRSVCKVRHLHHVRLLFIALNLSNCDIRLEPFSEIRGTHDGVNDGDDDQEDGDYSESCERLAHWAISPRSMIMVVHSDELEEKIGQSSEIEGLREVRSIDCSVNES